jgi:hypothetical protein
MKAIGSLPRRATGAPLPRLLRTYFQRLFNAPLHDVRLVVSEAPARLHARAFALGRTVHLAPALLRAGATEQRRVLGHEIMHVLQQRTGATRRPLRAEPAVLEAEAARAGRRVVAGRAVALRARTCRRAAPCVQRIKLTLKGTRDGDLDAPTLLHAIDSAIAAKVTSGIPAIVDGAYAMTSGAHWLDLLGRLSNKDATVNFIGKRSTLLDCKIKIGAGGAVMDVVREKSSERLVFSPDAAELCGYAKGIGQKRDLNYIKITDGFEKLRNAGLEDDDIARDMLRLMKGKATMGAPIAAHNEFLQGMVALMFGVESSRFPSAFLTSLLLLDLIRTRKCYGRAGTKRFNFVDSFDAGSFDFDCLYGGKFPCAVHEPGPGNALNRLMLGQVGGSKTGTANGASFNKTEGADMMMELNHRFVVPRREVTLVVHWLEARLGAQLANYRRTDLIALLKTRIDEATNASDELPDLPSSPKTDTGMHSNDAPGNRTKLIKGMTVYWLNYEKYDTKTSGYIWQEGKWVHTRTNCKKIGGRHLGMKALMELSYAKNTDARPRLEDFKEWTLKTDEDVTKAGNQACPHCCTA